MPESRNSNNVNYYSTNYSKLQKLTELLAYTGESSYILSAVDYEEQHLWLEA